ncbi:TAXI family TRAP transporter solute-binding subunit [Thermodesulfobacteriota bacterium]
MKRARILRVLLGHIIVIGLIFSVVYCTQKPAEAAEKLKVLVIGALAPGTTTYSAANAAGDVIRKYTDLRYAISPLSGIGPMFELMKKGHMHLAIGQGEDAAFAYKKPPAPFTKLKLFPDTYPFLRGVQTIEYRDAVLWACADANINTPEDIKGKKLPAGFTSQPMIAFRVEALLANYGLTMNDVIPVPVAGWAQQMRAASAGKVDVVYSSLANKPLLELKARRGIRLIPVNTSPKAVKAMQKNFPSALVKVRDRDPFYSSQKDVLPERFNTVSFGTFDLIASADVSADIIYQISKVLWEHYEELHVMKRFKKDWRPESMCSTAPNLPYHPGAIRWFKEKGVWTEELEALNERMLKP